MTLLNFFKFKVLNYFKIIKSVLYLNPALLFVGLSIIGIFVYINFTLIGLENAYLEYITRNFNNYLLTGLILFYTIFNFNQSSNSHFMPIERKLKSRLYNLFVVNGVGFLINLFTFGVVMFYLRLSLLQGVLYMLLILNLNIFSYYIINTKVTYFIVPFNKITNYFIAIGLCLLVFRFNLINLLLFEISDFNKQVCIIIFTLINISFLYFYSNDNQSNIEKS